MTSLTFLRQALFRAAMTKDDLSDIINVGIEVLIKQRYELPAFGSLLREVKAQRAAAYQVLFRTVHGGLSESARGVIDALFLVEEGEHTSPWNNLKTDAPKATLDGLRVLLQRYDQLFALADNGQALKGIPEVKRQQLALEGMSLDAASMMDMEPKKRYAVTLSLIQRQLARVIDDLCNVFCKQNA